MYFLTNTIQIQTKMLFYYFPLKCFTVLFISQLGGFQFVVIVFVQNNAEKITLYIYFL